MVIEISCSQASIDLQWESWKREIYRICDETEAETGNLRQVFRLFKSHPRLALPRMRLELSEVSTPFLIIILTHQFLPKVFNAEVSSVAAILFPPLCLGIQERIVHAVLPTLQ